MAFSDTGNSSMVPPHLSRKRRRRRRQDKPAIAARLVLDDHVKSDVGILSDDLFADLFPHLQDEPEAEQQDHDHDQDHVPDRTSTDLFHVHVAIAPWSPTHSASTTNWTVVPVTKSSALAPATVQFSPASLALQSFAAHLQQQHPAPSSSKLSRRAGIEILVLDVAAVALDTVFVSLENELVQRLEGGEGTFFREHPHPAAIVGTVMATNKNKQPLLHSASASSSPEERLAAALRVALGTLRVVHAGDLFPLPLPPHPVTHVPPNPGRVTLCEPVAQGVLVPHTRIVVSRGRVHSKRDRRRGTVPIAAPNGTGGIESGAGGGGGGGGGGDGDGDGDDTTNDQFYSAAEEREDRTDADAQTEDAESVTETESEDPGAEHGGGAEDDDEEDELSDDSMDDMISLQAPTLPATATTGNVSGVSTMQPGSPMTVGGGGGRGGRRTMTNGISTPMSVFSNFTATTARPDGSNRPSGRLFRAQGLVRPVPAELLFPKPGAEDDEEARVYVDTRDLPRIGCFSGDWVRVEAASEPPANGLGAFGLGSFNTAAAVDVDWRPVRVFALPEGYTQRPKTRIASAKHHHQYHQHHQHGGEDMRRMSFFESQVQKASTPAAVYLSPILLANMASPPCLRLAPLMKQQRASHSAKGPQAKLTGGMSQSQSQPPFAREVILQQVRTPITSERAVQTAVMAGLKWHFEKKLRIVKSGDLIAVPIDTQLGRTLQEAASSSAGGGGGSGESAVDQVLSLTTVSSSGSTRHDEVAWFKISHVQAMAKQDVTAEDALDEEDTWGSVAAVDVSQAHLEQTGSVTTRVPGTMTSTWRYYLGMKKLPIPSSSSSSSSEPSLAAVGTPSTTTVSVSAAPLVLAQDRRHVLPLRRRLRELLAAATSRRAAHLKMPPLAILVVSTQRNIGKATAVLDACLDIGLHAFAVDAYDVLNEASGGGGGGSGSDVKSEALLLSRAERATSCGPECCALLVRHVEALTADRMVSCIREKVLAPDGVGGVGVRVLVATTTEVDKVPDRLRGLFTHELEMNAPDEREREGILRTIVHDRGIALDPEVDLGNVALKTAALVAGDLVDVVERALVARQARLEKLSASSSSTTDTASEFANGKEAVTARVTVPATVTATATTPVTVRDVQIAGGTAVRGLTKADLDVAVDAARRNFADAIGAPKIPNVTWDDVGGLSTVKAAVTETIQLPLERPELFARGMKKRSGILFYGPPGTGKTLLAKAIATEYSLNFFSVKGPELLNMYIGESEANVRRVFARARDARPCVVFFDELDSVAPKRGNQGDSGGVMDRIVSQLLAELDGMSSSGDGSSGGGGGGVFVVGATNRPDLLDPALLRPGRFDKMLYLGVPDTHEKQLTILEALTRKFSLDPTVSLRSVAETLPLTYTGADLYALCSDAMLKAVTRQAAHIDARVRALDEVRRRENDQSQPLSTAAFFDHFARPDDLAVRVAEPDFAAARAELVPSVSAGELAHYEHVRAAFEGAASAGSSTTTMMQQHQQPLPLLGREAGSLIAVEGRGSGKGKERSGRGGGGKGKGKGKALALAPQHDGEKGADDEEDEEDDDEDEEDSNDEYDDDDGGKGKGKGKGKMIASFRDVGASDDDDGLYE